MVRRRGRRLRSGLRRRRSMICFAGVSSVKVSDTKAGRRVYTEAMIARQSAPIRECRQVLLLLLLIGAGVPAQDMFWSPVLIHIRPCQRFLLCVQSASSIADRASNSYCVCQNMDKDAFVIDTVRFAPSKSPSKISRDTVQCHNDHRHRLFGCACTVLGPSWAVPAPASVP